MTIAPGLVFMSSRAESRVYLVVAVDDDMATVLTLSGPLDYTAKVRVLWLEMKLANPELKIVTYPQFASL